MKEQISRFFRLICSEFIWFNLDFAIFFACIPIPLHALFAVLDCSCRAGGDARHAMRAVFAPFGAGGCKFYIIKRADLYALFARNAFIGRIEFIGFYEEFIENRINGAAHEFIVKIVPHGGETLVFL